VRHKRIWPAIVAPILAATILVPGVAHGAQQGVGGSGTAADPLSIGAVQGKIARSPLAPASGNGSSATKYQVRGVVTQLALSHDQAGTDQHGFFFQSRTGSEDGDPASSDGIFVYLGTFTSLIGGYTPQVGDEIVVNARVSEFFNFTELTSAEYVATLATGLTGAVQVTDARPPADAGDAATYWERHEGMQMRLRAGSGVISGTKVFAGTDDAEIWAIDRDDPLMRREDPYTRRVFRDAHPLDDQYGLVDNGNGNRIMIGPMGVKAAANDSHVVLPPARTFDTVTDDAVGGLYYAFNKYGIQVSAVDFTRGVDPSLNHPPATAERRHELAVSTFNLENLYDFRDDPTDGCDFVGNTGCPGVSPPFDYVPSSAEAYGSKLAGLADQIVNDLHAPDLILTQEAEDQDICGVSKNRLTCGGPDGMPDTLQELALTIKAKTGIAYASAADRSGADARGIISGFLYRTDRLQLAPVTAADPILGSSPQVEYRGGPLASNVDVSNPKTLNATLPSDVDTSTGVDGVNVYTRAPQVALFTVKARPGSSSTYQLWAVSNHFSSGPDTRIGQRTEQAAYGAAIVTGIKATHPHARVIYGGDLNVFPRPDDPIPAHPGDQLGPLYRAGLNNLWEELVMDVPEAAYSYVFDGQAQTLDNLFANEQLSGDFIDMRSAHINADQPTGRSTSDHDPQVARFESQPGIRVGDASVAEGDAGTAKLVFPVTLTRPLSQNLTVCAAAVPGTALALTDYDPFLGCATIPAGAVATSFTVNVRGDRRREGNERLSLTIAGLDAGLRRLDTTGTGTIVDDD
jgi:predicted extracellular nuclease